MQYHGPDQSGESRRRTDNPTLQKGLGALTSSFNYIGGTIGNALEVSFLIRFAEITYRVQFFPWLIVYLEWLQGCSVFLTL